MDHSQLWKLGVLPTLSKSHCCCWQLPWGELPWDKCLLLPLPSAESMGLIFQSQHFVQEFPGSLLVGIKGSPESSKEPMQLVIFLSFLLRSDSVSRTVHVSHFQLFFQNLWGFSLRKGFDSEG